MVLCLAADVHGYDERLLGDRGINGTALAAENKHNADCQSWVSLLSALKFLSLLACATSEWLFPPRLRVELCRTFCFHWGALRRRPRSMPRYFAALSFALLLGCGGGENEAPRQSKFDPGVENQAALLTSRGSKDFVVNVRFPDEETLRRKCLEVARETAWGDKQVGKEQCTAWFVVFEVDCGEGGFSFEFWDERKPNSKIAQFGLASQAEHVFGVLRAQSGCCWVLMKAGGSGDLLPVSRGPMIDGALPTTVGLSKAAGFLETAEDAWFLQSRSYIQRVDRLRVFAVSFNGRLTNELIVNTVDPDHPIGVMILEDDLAAYERMASLPIVKWNEPAWVFRLSAQDGPR